MEGNNEGKKATRQQVSQWVINAWELISAEGISNTWKHIFGNDLVMRHVQH